MSPRRTVSRRAVLGGAAASLGLPWLASLAPRTARATQDVPVRLVWWFCPNGMHMPGWTPEADGLAAVPSPILAPLAAHWGEVSVVSGLQNRDARRHRPPPHTAAPCSWLSGAAPTLGTVRAGVSADQLAARALGGSTPLRSLQLGMEGAAGSGACEEGFACAYAEAISWADASTPLPQITDPTAIFDRLVQGADPRATEAERARRQARRTSVLDTLLDEAGSLQRQLARADRVRLDQYLTSVRELERRVEVLQRLPACTAPAPDLSPPLGVESAVELMTDLMVLALTCDQTRVVSFMLGNGQSGRSFDFLGTRGGHHEISHHGGDAERQADLQIIDTWEVERLASFLSRLAATPEGEGSLLDATAVVFGAGIGDGDSHDPEDLPMLVAGRAGGALRPVGHLRAQDRPLVELHHAVLEAVGVGERLVGEEGVLEEILA